MGVIYLRTNLINGKQYVGQTKNMHRRNYSWNCLKHKYGNQLLTDERNKYGLDNFKTKILKECDDSELDQYEKYYIEKYNTIYPNGYNSNSGGKINFKHSDETKKKISESNKGNTPWNKGKTLNELFDDETAEKIREKIRSFGKTRIGEKNAFYGKTFKVHPMQGKHHTEEAKTKISKANMNGKTSFKIIQVKDNGEIFVWKSMREASRNGYDCGSISKACNGKYHNCGHRYKNSNWYYKDDYLSN